MKECINYDGVEYAQLYLKNGFDLSLNGCAAFDETLKFKGKGKNNFLANETLEDLNSIMKSYFQKMKRIQSCIRKNERS
jgi:hypothetical protein